VCKNEHDVYQKLLRLVYWSIRSDNTDKAAAWLNKLNNESVLWLITTLGVLPGTIKKPVMNEMVFSQRRLS